jgi:hypothetical protein
MQLYFYSYSDILSKESEVRMSAIIDSDIKIVVAVFDDPAFESRQKANYAGSDVCNFLSLYPITSTSQFLLSTPICNN